jgi:hypothetical protein
MEELVNAFYEWRGPTRFFRSLRFVASISRSALRGDS